MIEGVNITLGGRDYIVPALNFRALRACQPDLDLISHTDEGAFGAERMAAICRIAHAAIRRNYADVTIDEIEDGIDLNNVADVITAVLGQSGLVKTDTGEPTSGEAQSPSTGTGSMPRSSPTPGGTGSTSTNA